MRLLDALGSAAKRLEQAGIDDPLADAEVIVFHASGMDRLAAYSHNPVIDRKTLAKITRLVSRRIRGEPVQYIAGSVDFLGLHISVGKGVLIPRPETELLVQEAIRRLKRSAIDDLRILDLCTGTGCIALALAREFPAASVVGTDISRIAIGFAKRNASANGITNVAFLTGSLFDHVEDKVFNMVISNPPYIRADEIDTLQPEIRQWEPRNALDGGPDGLHYYRAILSGVRAHLRDGGTVMLELGYDQAVAVRAIAAQEGFGEIGLTKDYAGVERIFSAVFRKKSVLAPAGVVDKKR